MRRRLVVAAAAVTAMIVIAFCVPLAMLIRIIAANQAVDAGKLESRSLAGTLSAVRDRSTIADLVDQANAGSKRPVTVYLPDGSVLGVPVPVDDAVRLARQGRSFTTAGSRGSRDILVGVVGSDGQSTVVRVGVPSSLLRRGVARAWAILAVLGVLLVLVAVIVADRLARTIVAPIAQLVGVTRRLQQGHLDARAEPGGPPEVAEVGVAVNELADRIGDLLTAEREAVADLSHQLRTPLTALRLDADSLRDPEERERVAIGVDNLEGAVTRVITEARRTDRRATGGRAPAESDLGDAVRRRMAFWSVLAEDQGRAWTVDAPPHPTPVGVAPDDLDVAIDALITNVFTHTPEGTPFDLTVAGDIRTGWTLVVDDGGPGLPGDAPPRRGASAGGGTGLGLDIVRRTAEAAGGGVTVGRSANGGAKIAVEFGATAATVSSPSPPASSSASTSSSAPTSSSPAPATVPDPSSAPAPATVPAPDASLPAPAAGTGRAG